MSTELTTVETEVLPLLNKSLANVRDELKEDPYIEEVLEYYLLGATEVPLVLFGMQ